MKVSIITISLNNGDKIENTIKSVLAQSYQDIEYIVVDGQSTDNTSDIFNLYKNRISKIICENDEGIYDAMNKGVKVATGDIIGFINADDMLNSNDCISEIVKAFEIHGSDVVYGDIIFIDPKNTSKVVRYWRAGEYKKDQFKKGWMSPHLSTYIKKKYYDRYGGYKTDFKIAADYELLLRFMYKYEAKAVYLPKVIARMRAGGISNRSFISILLSNYEVYKSWRVNGYNISPFIIIRKPLKKVIQLFLRQ